MPIATEFTLDVQDRPGTLGKFCRALAERNINILAFQTYPAEGRSLVHLVVDDPSTAKAVLDAERVSYTEADVAQVKLPHRPGELARAASRLGDAGVNINYAYVGAELGTNTPLLILGVAKVGQAVTLLDQAAAAAGTT